MFDTVVLRRRKHQVGGLGGPLAGPSGVYGGLGGVGAVLAYVG